MFAKSVGSFLSFILRTYLTALTLSGVLFIVARLLVNIIFNPCHTISKNDPSVKYVEVISEKVVKFSEKKALRAI